jgi:CRP/FNR family transcriptional regulator, cyclic AMP receptor protein
MAATDASTMHAMADQLAACAIFSSVDPKTLVALASTGQRRNWAAGKVIFQRGDAGDHMLAITSGRVRLSLGSAQGKELMLRHLESGDILGELAVLDGQPRSADAVALDDCTAILLRRNRFLEVAAIHPDLAISVARYLCSMLRNTNFQMESIALYDLQMRLIRFFLFSLRQAHGDKLPDRVVLHMSFNQTDLSAVLGASRPKINQALQALIAEGAIQRDGDRFVCQVRRLREMAEMDEDGL